jgi:hypothetical protein
MMLLGSVTSELLTSQFSRQHNGCHVFQLGKHYGTHKDVLSTCCKAVTTLKKTTSFEMRCANSVHGCDGYDEPAGPGLILTSGGCSKLALGPTHGPFLSGPLGTPADGQWQKREYRLHL